jgi:hypothetical protein
MTANVPQYNPEFLAGGLWHPRRRVAAVLCGLALALLLVSTGVHFSLYLGFNFATAYPAVWWGLQLSILIHVLVGAVYKRQPFFRGPSAYVKEPQALIYLTMILVTSTLFYAMINFAHYYWVMRYGYPDTVNGQLLLILPHGQKPVPLSPEQFSLYQLYQARKVSGHWMLCHTLPLLTYYDWLTDRVI